MHYFIFTKIAMDLFFKKLFLWLHWVLAAALGIFDLKDVVVFPVL